MKFIHILLILSLLSCNKDIKTKSKDAITVDFTPKFGNLTDFKTVTFPSKDGLMITADLYLIEQPKNVMLLCHQAQFSRGEYIETAKKLNKLGYSCIAIDQRSGKIANNVVNETAKLAKDKGVKVKSYYDAKPDIEAAIDYVYQLNKSKPFIIVGSSYSASLALILATKNDKIKAVAAFSPGEYLKGIEVVNSIKNLNKPVFVTSSKKEIAQVEGIISTVISKNKTQYKPTVEGIHGSRVLWRKTKGHQDYWAAFKTFLKNTSNQK